MRLALILGCLGTIHLLECNSTGQSGTTESWNILFEKGLQINKNSFLQHPRTLGSRGSWPYSARLNEDKKLADLWECWPLIKRVPLALGETALSGQEYIDETKARYVICEASAK